MSYWIWNRVIFCHWTQEGELLQPPRHFSKYQTSDWIGLILSLIQRANQCSLRKCLKILVYSVGFRLLLEACKKNCVKMSNLWRNSVVLSEHLAQCCSSDQSTVSHNLCIRFNFRLRRLGKFTKYEIVVQVEPGTSPFLPLQAVNPHGEGSFLSSSPVILSCHPLLPSPHPGSKPPRRGSSLWRHSGSDYRGRWGGGEARNI